jgi:8-oxo-dGTP pyrophosphatase MutT (NUDIX family)
MTPAEFPYNPYGVSRARFAVVPRVLVFVTRDDALLLLQRASHKKLWPGLYNPPGGHIERDETPDEAAVRELQEETGLQVQSLHLRGLLMAHAQNDLPGVVVFIYHAQAAGTLHKINDEGTPHWIPFAALDAIPTLPDFNQLRALVLDQPDFFTLYKIAHSDGSESVRVVYQRS